MSVSLDDLKTILQFQQAKSNANWTRFLDAMTRKLSFYSTPTSKLDKCQYITNSACELNYYPESDIIFDSWLHRFEDILRAKCPNLDDAAKMHFWENVMPRRYNKGGTFWFTVIKSSLNKTKGKHNSMLTILYHHVGFAKHVILLSSFRSIIIIVATVITLSIKNFAIHQIKASQHDVAEVWDNTQIVKSRAQ